MLQREVKELEEWFRLAELPASIKLNDRTFIFGVKAFVKSSFLTLNKNKDNKRYRPYLDRVKELKELLIKNEKQ